jgi:hypothetical protein
MALVVVDPQSVATMRRMSEEDMAESIAKGQNTWI